MHTQESATSQSEPLWHLGRFACELFLQSDPPFLSVLKDDESILEVTVHSALEAKENADALRVIVQQYLVTDEPHGRSRRPHLLGTRCAPPVAHPTQSRPMTPRLASS